MSSVYKIERAPTGRAKCKGPKPCSGAPIEKGDLRFGTFVKNDKFESIAWRHWKCVTPKIINNVNAGYEKPEDIEGFDELSMEDQEVVRKALKEGQVTEDAGNVQQESDKKDPPKKKASKKKAKADNDEEAGSDHEVPAVPKKKAPAKPRKKKAETVEDGEPKDAANGEIEPTTKKAPTKGRKKKSDATKDGEEQPADGSEDASVPKKKAPAKGRKKKVETTDADPHDDEEQVEVSSKQSLPSSKRKAPARSSAKKANKTEEENGLQDDSNEELNGAAESAEEISDEYTPLTKKSRPIAAKKTASRKKKVEED